MMLGLNLSPYFLAVAAQKEEKLSRPKPIRWVHANGEVKLSLAIAIAGVTSGNVIKAPAVINPKQTKHRQEYAKSKTSAALHLERIK